MTNVPVRSDTTVTESNIKARNMLKERMRQHKTYWAPSFDLLFLRMVSGEKPKAQKEKLTISREVDWLHKLVGSIMQTAQPGLSCIASLDYTFL